MVTLEIDDDTYALWQREAAARGVSVSEWLINQTTNKPSDPGVEPALKPSPFAWTDWLRRFAHRRPATGVPMDDSRESIYD